MRRAWPHVLAAFVLFHVVGSCVDIIPDVSLGMNKNAWKEPRVRVELDKWAARLGQDRATFEDAIFALGQDVMVVRRATGAPFRPYLRATGQAQAWAMFIAGTRHIERFQVRARTCAANDACDWFAMYTRSEPADDFMRGILEDARVRSAVFRWGWPQSRRSYDRGCRAIAKRVFAARADVAIVQCRFSRSLAPSGNDRDRDDNDASKHDEEWGRGIVVPRVKVAP